MNPRNVLITGGSGFIGSHIVKRFSEQNCHITLFDIHKPQFNLTKNVTFIRGNILEVESLQESVESADTIIHLVGLADAGIAQNNPMKSFNLNILSLQNILELCRIYNGKKVVFPSSAAVYGITEDLPIKENFPQRPTNVYSWHKYLCEKMILSYEKNYGLKYVILRLFNVFGKGNEGVIGIFLEKAKKGEMIDSYGPYQYRDFIYSGDVAEAVYRAVAYEKAVNRIINIGSGKGIQIRDILDVVCEIYPKATWQELQAEFIMYDSIADITLAKILLDFEPHHGPNFFKSVIINEMINNNSPCF